MKVKVKVLKEPRGFIKIIELVFCICAFALVCAYEELLVFRVDCNPVPATTARAQASTTTHTTTTTTVATTSTSTSTTTTSTTVNTSSTTEDNPSPSILVKRDLSGLIVDDSPKDKVEYIDYLIHLDYPFRLKDSYQPSCDGINTPLYLEDKTSSQAVYFVFTGVLSFIYVIFIFGIYLFVEDLYSGTNYISLADFIAHIVIVVFWFSACIAWAAGVVNFKNNTSEEDLIEANPQICQEPYDCSVISDVSYTSLDISVVFGFATLVIFGGNIWFIYKETGLRSDPTSSQA